MSIIDRCYENYRLIPGDINEHFPTIKKYSSGCESIIEFGVRYIVSTWALLAGKPKEMISVDIVHPRECGGNLDLVFNACKLENIDFKFHLGSDLDFVIEKNIDLLFIDTFHYYDQLTKELTLHNDKVNKYIIMHDTELLEMINAINDFLLNNPEWEIEEIFHNNNGLTILKRKQL